MAAGNNDWGLPDWREVDAYPDTSAPAHRFAWEFLRRNPEYREHWTREMQRSDGVPELSLVNDRGRSVQESETTQVTAIFPAASFDIVAHKFGLVIWNDPSFSTGYFFKGRGTTSMRAPNSGHLTLNELEIAYVFDLSVPLKVQFENALADAEAWQKKKTGEVKNIRPHIGKHVTYLRILDALEQATDRKIVEQILFSHNDDPSKTYENHLLAARELRDRGYRALAAYPRKEVLPK